MGHPLPTGGTVRTFLGERFQDLHLNLAAQRRLRQGRRIRPVFGMSALRVGVAMLAEGVGVLLAVTWRYVSARGHPVPWLHSLTGAPGFKPLGTVGAFA